MRVILSLSFLLLTFISSAQNLHIGVFAGISAYNGDLEERIFPAQLTNGAVGITANYELSEKLVARAGLTYTVVGGADRYHAKADVRVRNLSFETSIIELSMGAEYYLFDLYKRRYSPYLMAAAAIYKFNPYTYNGSDQVFLKPLSTEGQGINGYGKEYRLTQFAIPFGGGVKFVINDNFRIAIEGGIRKLFTDYLDDVSTNYADPADLLKARGQLSVDLSYRGDETAIGSPVYPLKGTLRGSPKSKDYYYFGGLHLTYRLSGPGGSGRKNGTGCPVNVY